jgi:hypothetical protein
MKYLLECLFKLNHLQIVIPAQAGIQAGKVHSLEWLCEGRKNIRFGCSSLKESMKKLLVGWIPACAGMTGLVRVEVIYET